MDTPSTKDKEDRTVDVGALVRSGVCTKQEYAQIRNASMMAFGVVSNTSVVRWCWWTPRQSMESTAPVRSWSRTKCIQWIHPVSGGWTRTTLMTRDGKPVSFSKEFARGMVTEKQQFSPEQTRAIAARYIRTAASAWR